MKQTGQGKKEESKEEKSQAPPGGEGLAYGGDF